MNTIYTQILSGKFGILKSKTLKSVVLFVMISVLAAFSAGISMAEPTGSSIDPTYIGVGARPLGMGKAYVGVAEDADSIFLNPAGLARFRNLKIMSMYSNLMGDVNYQVVGAAMPLEIGSVGLGYIASRVDNIWIFGPDAGAPTPTPTPLGLGSQTSSVTFVSYGMPLSTILPFGKNLYVGANLKFFNQTADGTEEASGGNGKGMDLDLGILYTPKTWLSLGLNQQNILPSSMGGVITYRNGIEESIPTLTKLGANVNLLGSRDKALINAPVKLNLAMDADLDLQYRKPAGFHIGAELWPVKNYVALRLGLDKDPTPGSVNPAEGANLTYGVGLRLAGFAFDYAYHPYSSLPENSTHFFSVSYVGPDEPEKPKSYFTIIKPRDKFITRKDAVLVSGVADLEVNAIEINGVNVQMEQLDNIKTFMVKVPLAEPGKHLIVAEVFDKNGYKLEQQTRRILRLMTFTDVHPDFWAVEPVEYGATAGIVEGFPDGTFHPNTVLSRAEMAAMLVRTTKEEIKTVLETKIFPDLPSSHWAARYIDAASEMGLVVGYPDKKFRPNIDINRAEGVSVATRFNGDPGDVPEENPYLDVSTRHWAAGAVDAAKNKGLLDYLISDRFRPKNGLTRAEVVEILTKTEFGKKKIDDLLDWKKGYTIKAISRPVKPGSMTGNEEAPGYTGKTTYKEYPARAK